MVCMGAPSQLQEAEAFKRSTGRGQVVKVFVAFFCFPTHYSSDIQP